jgi:hypothetical protein
VSLVQRRGVGDALTALLCGAGGDEQMGGTDEALLHGGSRLDGDQLVQQLGSDALAERGQRCGEDPVSW